MTKEAGLRVGYRPGAVVLSMNVKLGNIKVDIVTLEEKETAMELRDLLNDAIDLAWGKLN